MPVNVSFDFPEGCKERYAASEMPELPRIGDFIEDSRPESNRYRVRSVTFEINSERERCDTVRVKLDICDKKDS
jgi:hypothetical protein